MEWFKYVCVCQITPNNGLYLPFLYPKKTQTITAEQDWQLMICMKNCWFKLSKSLKSKSAYSGRRGTLCIEDDDDGAGTCSISRCPDSPFCVRNKRQHHGTDWLTDRQVLLPKSALLLHLHSVLLTAWIADCSSASCCRVTTLSLIQVVPLSQRTARECQGSLSPCFQREKICTDFLHLVPLPLSSGMWTGAALTALEHTICSYGRWWPKHSLSHKFWSLGCFHWGDSSLFPFKIGLHLLSEAICAVDWTAIPSAPKFSVQWKSLSLSEMPW